MKVFIGNFPSGDEEREISIELHDYDTWNMDHTLALIALPMLKQLKEQKHGSPTVDLEDVPEELRLHGTPRNESMQYDMFADEEYSRDCWDAHHARWDWVMDEMIFAFESECGVNEDWGDKYHSGKLDLMFVPVDKDHNVLGPPRKIEEETDPEIEDKIEFWEMVHGPNHTAVFDVEGYRKEADRIQNGFRLFGKYYQGLWD